MDLYTSGSSSKLWIRWISVGDHMPCTKCTELERQLKVAWETILRMDATIKELSDLLTAIEAERAAKAPA